MAQLSDNAFKIIQKCLFGIAFVFFIIMLATIVYQSVGYSYDKGTKKFVRTGAIYFESYPVGASVFINAKKQNFKTPHILRNVLPKEYSITLVKKGFMEYKTQVHVKSAAAANSNAVLIPEIDVENITRLPFMVNKAFKIKHSVDFKKILFTDKGIFSCNKDYTNYKLLSHTVLPVNDAYALNGIFIYDDLLIVWSKQKIWRLPISKDNNLLNNDFIIYKAQENIKYVARALRGRYLIVHDYKKVVAIDVLNSQVSYEILKLKSARDEVVFYAMSDVLEVFEKNIKTNQVEIKRVELRNKFLNRLNKLNRKNHEKVI